MIMKVRIPYHKYHFMIGTTSRVPGQPGWHYFILDIDGPMSENLFTLTEHCRSVVQKTKSGWHVYFPIRMRLRRMLKYAVANGADRTWAKLALERGWAFLADKSLVKIPWPVERKIIGWRSLQHSMLESNLNKQKKKIKSHANAV